MRADDATWSAAAYRAGYADPAHLVREFRALLGDSPQAWRRRATADSFKTRSAAQP
jgi:AraC-like DNA-binding protein